jgi:hypothetical protein
MQKEAQTQLVHHLALRKRQTLSDEASKPLAQGVVPSLDMCRQASLFAHCRMVRRRDDHLSSLLFEPTGDRVTRDTKGAREGA